MLCFTKGYLLTTMSTSSRVCFLLDKTTKKKIVLPHGQPIYIGRSKQTQIQDIFVSKKQILCVADTENCQVKFKPVGKAICGVDGYATVKDRTYILGHGHQLELRLGCHQFDIIFDPPPDANDEECTHVAKKPKLDFPVFNQKVKSKEGDDSIVNVGIWEDIDRKELLIYTAEACEPKSKIAAFDIDGTIIKTKSGARFPKNKDDWVLNFNNIPKQLKELHNDGFKIVFFTNQSGVGKDSSKIKDFKQKIENIIAKLVLPIQVFIATGKGSYRKPMVGMWNTLSDIKNGNETIQLSNSFYVGDAAGREKNWAPKRNKDHSCADRLFALNIGIQFHTPEEYFLKSNPVSYVMPDFNPTVLNTLKYPDFQYGTPNVILMVGGPGSGKSYFCHSVLIPKGYVHINRDTLGSWQKCVKILEENKHLNCVIDNTNPDKASRARFLEVCKKFNIECRAFVMSTSYYHCKHNNRFRELTDKSHLQVNEIIINSYKKNYQEPELEEGFEEILKIPFVPEFKDADREKLYKMFLLEK